MSINFYFYFFFLLIILCALMIIISKNPVQSVFFLILIFLMTTLLFILVGAEFLAIAVLIIYVGAVAILFLFVVMMLNLRILELYSSFYNHIPIGGVIGLFFFMVFAFLIFNNFGALQFNYFSSEDYFVLPQYLTYSSNISYIGYVLYNFYSFYVIIASLILLVAMLGAIILTVDFEYRSISKNSVFKRTLPRTDLKF